MNIPPYSIPRVDLVTNKSEKELVQYTRHEFRDRNNLWMCSQTGGSSETNPVNTMEPAFRLLAPVSRIARAVSSLFF
jgi:hypothetical protein